MKRFFALLTSCMFAWVPAFSQAHLSFSDCEMGTDPVSFKNALITKGFKADKRDPDGPFMKGRYTGEEVDVFIATAPESGSVCLVMVSYAPRRSWRKLKGDYETVRMMLTSRYGEPSEVAETFDYPYTEADGLRALEYGKCKYLTYYRTVSGEITLSLSNEGGMKIYFVDKRMQER